jgi:hypothetical protein
MAPEKQRGNQRPSQQEFAALILSGPVFTGFFIQ